MGFVSNYIWERAADGGTNPISLVLQQVKVKGREACLLCICGSSCCGSGQRIGGQMAEQLVEWFHKVCLPACEGRVLPMPAELMEPELEMIYGSLSQGGRAALDYGGLLLIGNQFYLFGEGNIAVQLINYRYNRPHMRMLAAPMAGRMQRGIGLLLHTPELLRGLKKEEICQILHGEGVWREERIARRLRELCREGRSRGSTGAVGGIYLQVV
ncbi:MAG: hypothetical protein NC543_01410 [bacterium]|nr:hypothetical protein [bacterium]MCM1375119.1 hypothetical protein [Muribaculum sp.]